MYYYRPLWWLVFCLSCIIYAGISRTHTDKQRRAHTRTCFFVDKLDLLGRTLLTSKTHGHTGGRSYKGKHTTCINVRHTHTSVYGKLTTCINVLHALFLNDYSPWLNISISGRVSNIFREFCNPRFYFFTYINIYIRTYLLFY